MNHGNGSIQPLQIPIFYKEVALLGDFILVRLAVVTGLVSRERSASESVSEILFSLERI